MKPELPPTKPNFLPPLMDFRFVGVGAQVGCVTLVIVLVAVFGGIALDRLLGTKPILTLILVLGSAPLALWLTYKLALYQIQTAQSTPVAPPEKDAAQTDTQD